MFCFAGKRLVQYIRLEIFYWKNLARAQQHSTQRTSYKQVKKKGLLASCSHNIWMVTHCQTKYWTKNFSVLFVTHKFLSWLVMFLLMLFNNVSWFWLLFNVWPNIENESQLYSLEGDTKLILSHSLPKLLFLVWHYLLSSIVGSLYRVYIRLFSLSKPRIVVVLILEHKTGKESFKVPIPLICMNYSILRLLH